MKRLATALHTLVFMVFASVSAVAQEQMAPIVPSDKPLVLEDIRYLQADGKPSTLAKDKGKLTILHFWATWCVPCVKELPELDKIAQEYAGQGLKVLPISMVTMEGEIAKITAFYKEHEINSLPVLLDDKNKTMRSQGVKGLPTSVFINGKGKIIGRADGAVDWEKARPFLEKHLK